MLCSCSRVGQALKERAWPSPCLSSVSTDTRHDGSNFTISVLPLFFAYTTRHQKGYERKMLPRKRQRTPNNRTTTGYQGSSELWAVLQPLLPCTSIRIALVEDGPAWPIAVVPTRFSMCCELDANGKPSTRPNSVRIRRPTLADLCGWKQWFFSSEGSQASSSLMNCVGSSGTG